MTRAGCGGGYRASHTAVARALCRPHMRAVAQLLVACALALPELSLCAALASDSKKPARQAQTANDSLDEIMMSLARAFRTKKAETLTPLLPAEGKVFLSLGSVGGGAGYYGPDQVYFIFNGIFSHHDTIRFDIRPQKVGGAPKKTERSGLSYCVADWAFRRLDGRAESAQIHFVLCVKDGAWSLMEIREAR